MPCITRIDDMGIESFEWLLVVAEARYSLSFCLVSPLSHHLDFRSSTDG